LHMKPADLEEAKQLLNQLDLQREEEDTDPLPPTSPGIGGRNDAELESSEESLSDDAAPRLPPDHSKRKRKKDKKSVGNGSAFDQDFCGHDFVFREHEMDAGTRKDDGGGGFLGAGLQDSFNAMATDGIGGRPMKKKSSTQKHRAAGGRGRSRSTSAGRAQARGTRTQHRTGPSSFLDEPVDERARGSGVTSGGFFARREPAPKPRRSTRHEKKTGRPSKNGVVGLDLGLSSDDYLNSDNEVSSSDSDEFDLTRQVKPANRKRNSKSNNSKRKNNGESVQVNDGENPGSQSSGRSFFDSCKAASKSITTGSATKFWRECGSGSKRGKGKQGGSGKRATLLQTVHNERIVCHLERIYSQPLSI